MQQSLTSALALYSSLACLHLAAATDSSATDFETSKFYFSHTLASEGDDCTATLGDFAGREAQLLLSESDIDMLAANDDQGQARGDQVIGHEDVSVQVLQIHSQWNDTATTTNFADTFDDAEIVTRSSARALDGD